MEENVGQEIDIESSIHPTTNLEQEDRMILSIHVKKYQQNQVK
jgi:hypothetical protein